MNSSNWNVTSPEVYPSINITTRISVLDILKYVLASFNLLLGIPTHSYILWFMATGGGGGVSSDVFMFNLTVCELVFGLNALFFMLGQTFFDFLKVQRFLLGLAITGRPLFQCLMCVERYLAVIHPVTFLKYKPLRYKILCSAVAWVVVLCSCMFCVLTFIFSEPTAYTWFYMMQFLVFLSIELFCCVAVLRALKQSGPGERGREKEEENHIKKRAFHLILITTVTMFIMFIPYIITGFLIVLRQDVTVICFFSFCCFVLAAYVHPALYLQRNGKLNFCFPKKLLS